MLQHSYKQLEEAYQRGVNKDHKSNPARMHPMSSQQGKGCQEMPVTQIKPAQYSHDSQSDSDQDFDVTTVNPNAESMRMDGAQSHPQDGHMPHHVRPKANNMDQHAHQVAPRDIQGPYIGHSHSPANREDEIRHLQSKLDQVRRDARSMSDDIRELVAGIQTLSSTLIHNSNNSSMNTTHNNSSRRHQLSISVLNDIDTFDGKQGHKLEDWLADVENAAAIVEEDEVVVTKGKARGLARDLIKEHESQPWHHIKEQLRNHLNNASIHTYTSRFMEIQQKDSETLTAYIHRFKKEAKHCDFNSHPAKIRIFLKGLINSSRIAPSVYEKGPTTIEDTISIVEKISSAQCIAASFSQNHQVSMMKRGRNEHHTPEHHHTPTHHQPINQDCSNCGQIGHPWFTCPCIICDGCNQHGHIYRHCWERIPPSGTSSPPDNHHSRGRRPSLPRYTANRCDDRRSRSRSSVRIHQRDRSASCSRHPSTDRHTSRDRNTGRRHTPDRHRTQSCSPHRQ